ncbi:hypothetical protein F511_02449 [Dorcoceras hygrometricum]|nr:hypothetical protein F511_02449 [Dorcoceras hygrometricum]
MKLARIIPTKIFKGRKKSPSVSRSETDQSSFGSRTTSSSCSDDGSLKIPGGPSTPKSVLPSSSSEIRSNDWFKGSHDVFFELKQAFEMIDCGRQGKVKKEQLVSLLSSLGAEPPSDEELNTMLSEVDKDGDGCISLEEFYAIGSAFAKPACDWELRELFSFFDSDGDGKISAEELYKVFGIIGGAGCTVDDCRRMIRHVDRNGDGFVCFEDFSLMMEQQR